MSNAAIGQFDIRLVDTERVEVLKGPQGTLYGSNALAGLVRNIPVAPNTNEVEGKLTFNASAQDESDDYNNSIEAVLNLPLVDDQLALRIATYKFDNAGYVDAISTPNVEGVAAATGSTVIVEDDVGGSTVTGGRATLLWTPTDNFETSVVFGTQKTDLDGSSQEMSSVGLRKASYLNMAHGRNDVIETDYTSLVMQYDFGSAMLTSASSLMRSDKTLSYNLFPYVPNAFLGQGQTDIVDAMDVFSQEIRLTSSLNGPIQFIAGLFYEDVDQDQTQISSDPISAAVFVDADILLDYEQKAFFGEISYKIDDLWELTLGGRYFDYDRGDRNVFNPSVWFPAAVETPVDTSEKDQIFKANLSFTPNDNSLIYFQWSEGFRLGKGQHLPAASQCDVNGDNRLDGTDAVLASSIQSDSIENFELGAKLVLLDDRLVLNSTVFRINWDNLPVAIVTPGTDTCAAGTTVFNNLGEAYSEGVEVEASYALTPNLVASFTTSYIDSAWTKAALPAVKGEQLSFSPNSTAVLAMQYNFELNAYSGFMRTDISYIGEYENSTQSALLPVSGDYININLRAGISLDQWSLAL